MGLLTGLCTLPLAPVRSVVWLAEQVRRQAEQELYDPQRIRRAIQAAEEDRAAGRISDEECEQIQDSLVAMLVERHGA